MRQETMIFDSESERLDIRFASKDYYDGLHCGEYVDQWQMDSNKN